MKVFVFGASGYIGNAVAVALRRQGHIVYGLVRGEEKAKKLRSQEIIPVLGDIENPSTYASTLDKVGVVIDTVFTYSQGASNQKLMQAVCSASKTLGQKKRYIYTSGVLVYGNRPNEILDENAIPTPGQMLKWRYEFENQVVKITEAEGVVVRPGFVYGGSVNMFFGYEKNGEIPVIGNPNKRWSWIHLDDLANAYVKIAEASGSAVGGQVFNVGDDTRVTYAHMREVCAKTAGASGPVVFKPIPENDWMSVLFDCESVTTSQKLKTTLGWVPLKGPFLDEVAIYYEAVKASKAEGN